MSFKFRSALMVIAAASASQVAPAQQQDAEPLIATGSSVLPTAVVLQPVEAQDLLDDNRLTVPAEPVVATPVVEEVEEPIIDRKASLAEKVAELRGSDPGDRNMECLAAGIYFESKSESLEGQLAVGHVIADRAASGRFPSSYCGVLFQRSQFSFVRGKSYPSVPRSSRQWQNAVAIAKIVDADMHKSPVANALFFHAKRVSPGWRLKRLGSVGNHIFYR